MAKAKKPVRKASPAKRPAAKPAKAATPKPPAKPTTGKPAAKAAAGKTPVDAKPAKPEMSVAGRIYQRGKLVDGILHIDTATGKILRVSKGQELPQHLDLGKLALLPGAVDVHVHFREPGYTHKEDLFTGSVSAAFGGVTGFVDMPNTLPATTTLRTVKDKLAMAGRQSVVDYGVWAGGTWYTGEIQEMLKWALGVKTYLGATTGDLLLEDQARFADILKAAGMAGRPVALHCESQRILNNLRRNEATLEEHDQARPPLAEVEAIYDAMKACAGLKKAPPVHIAHIASPDALQAARSAKFSAAVTPHHLLLDSACGLRHAYGKMNPPLRSPTVKKQMWDLFAKGQIPIVESDHAPHTQVEKEDNFHAAPAGVPGVETMVPLLLAQVQAKNVDLATVVSSTTLAPLAMLGIEDRGHLEAGYKADFAVYDLTKTTKLEAGMLHSRCGWTPFEGHKVILPSHTFLAGKPVVADGELAVAAGNGKPLRPLPSPLN